MLFQSLVVTLALLMIPKLSFTFEVSITNITVKRHLLFSVASKTLHCDVCDRDFKGETQLRNHQKSKSHRKALRALDEHFTYETLLVSCQNENKLESAKILKNIFGIGLTDVLEILNNLPHTICKDNSSAKAKRIAKELSQHQIVAQVNRVKIENPDKRVVASNN